ncbi:MAG: YitT family protein [Clostridiales bacterium]|nr:YitT family protein [Clostridiales bacterium]
MAKKDGLNRQRLLLLSKHILFVLIGTFMMSVAINGLFLPQNILSGGITGIALLFHLLFDINTSIIILIVNIPIFILGYMFINKKFILWSAFGMGALSFFLFFTDGVTFQSQEMMTTILLGGVINGFGLGLVFRANSSCGGSDIVSKIINRYFSYSISTLNFSFNVIVVALSIYFFGIDIAVQTLATMYVTAIVMKFVLEGINYKRTVFIISNHRDDISRAITHKLKRGCTILSGTGGYTGQTRNILYCVIGITQLSKLKSIVCKIDPSAFMNVAESKMVFGKGRGFVNTLEEDK